MKGNREKTSLRLYSYILIRKKCIPTFDKKLDWFFCQVTDLYCIITSSFLNFDLRTNYNSIWRELFLDQTLFFVSSLLSTVHMALTRHLVFLLFKKLNRKKRHNTFSFQYSTKKQIFCGFIDYLTMRQHHNGTNSF